MKNARVPFLTLAAVVTALALSACAVGTSTSSTPTASDASSSAPVASAFNSDDVMFAQVMIPHHKQAVRMTDNLLAKDGVDPMTIDLATQIKAAQAPEITTMQAWLTDWNATDDDMAGMDHGTDGMMSDDDMMKLKNASGTDAGALYLKQMIMHHEGALVMAQTELADGENADALALAEAIVSSQTAEITTMNDLLAAR